MGFGAPIYWTEEVPGCEFMYAVPFGLVEEGMHAWLYEGRGLELLKELFKHKQYNILSFPIGNAGEAMGGWFDRKIEKIADFNGLNIRMSGFCAKVYEKLEAKERWMVAKESLNAFEKGEINAIVCQGPYHDHQHRFHRVAKYYYYPGWQEPTGVLALIINTDAWGSLPANLQENIKSASDKTYRYIHNQFESMNSKYLKILQQDKRVELIEFPPGVLDRLEHLSREVLEEEAKNNTQFKRVYEAFKKFKEENKEYSWCGNLYGTMEKRENGKKKED